MVWNTTSQHNTKPTRRRAMATKLERGPDNIWRMPDRSMKAMRVWRSIPAKPVVGLVVLGAGGWLALKSIGLMMGLFWWVAGMILPGLVIAGVGTAFVMWIARKLQGR